MRRYLILSMTAGLFIASTAFGQDWGQGGMYPPPPQGGFGGPPMGFQGGGSNGPAAAIVSPDSKYLYVVSKSTLYQYSSDGLKLEKSVALEASTASASSESTGMPPMPQMPQLSSSAAIHVSPNGKKIYVISGKNLYLIDAGELKVINKVAVE